MTKQEVLDLLLRAYDGPGSAEEGTFAGDVLRACADGMAQLWSLEIDGLERRAFVSTAAGDWLTRVCADRGVPRLEGESDGDLRARALERLARRPASGNADDYRTWCGEVEGVRRVSVFPLARGRGTVDIVAVGTDGGPPSREVLEAAQAVVDRERPVGADARVFGAAAFPVDVSAWVTLAEGGSLETVRRSFAAALEAYLRSLEGRTVRYAPVLRLLLDCPGVLDAADLLLGGAGESLTLPERAVPAPGVLELRGAVQ